LPIDQLAAETLQLQIERSKNIPKTGNKILDMLNSNGIPLEATMKRLREMINNQQNPTEQVSLVKEHFIKGYV
jgi:UDP-N-acetylglucosamine 2-epimerase